MRRSSRRLAAVVALAALFASLVVPAAMAAEPAPSATPASTPPPLITPLGRTEATQPVIKLQLPASNAPQQAPYMMLDGVEVEAQWDPENLVLSYTPKEPLAEGPHFVMTTIGLNWGFVIGPTTQPSMTEPTPVAEDFVAGLNRQRQTAGLQPVIHAPWITGAAQGHMAYITQNQLPWSFEEVEGLPGFIGVSPGHHFGHFGQPDSRFERYALYRAGCGIPNDDLKEWLNRLDTRIDLLDPATFTVGYAPGVVRGERWAYLVIGKEKAASRDPVLWPYPGQQGVPIGAEPSDQIARGLSPEARTGYPISLAFSVQPAALQLSRATLIDGQGVAVPTINVPAEKLDGVAVAILPKEPLKPATTYTVTMQGSVDWGQGPASFEKSWSFTTEPAAVQEQVKVTVMGKTDSGRVYLEVQGYRPDMRFFLGELPVRQFQVEPIPTAPGGPQIVSFLAPVGYMTNRQLNYVVWPGRAYSFSLNVLLPDDLRNPFSPVRKTITLAGRTATVDGIVHLDGELLLPEESLKALGVQVYHHVYQTRTRLAVTEAGPAPGPSQPAAPASPKVVYVPWGIASAFTEDGRVPLDIGIQWVGGRAYFPMAALELLGPVVIADPVEPAGATAPAGAAPAAPTGQTTPSTAP